MCQWLLAHSGCAGFAWGAGPAIRPVSLVSLAICAVMRQSWLAHNGRAALRASLPCASFSCDTLWNPRNSADGGHS